MAHANLAVEDRFAITDLLTAYSWALDTGDPDALASLFTADATVLEEVFEDPDVWHGREAIRRLSEHYRNAAGFPGRQHHVSQSMFEPDGGGVRVRSFVFVTECHGEPPYLLRFTGWYDDYVVREADGAWRFRSRTIRLWDGEVLKNFPGRGKWVPRKRPPELVRR
ncbi:MAG TPA: nuclear transport factor 2 family protein [Steroidobacteraceae bacterium]|jgi:hypothetical protein|nr:nuclear transport factor 2 family protein [Steroidobacteraceae bacterium]